MNNRNAIAAALIKVHKTVETSPAYADAVADVLIALTEPQLAEAKKHTDLLAQIAASLEIQNKRAAFVPTNSPIFVPLKADTSGLPG